MGHTYRKVLRKHIKLILASSIILTISSVIAIFAINYNDEGIEDYFSDSAASKADMTIKNIHYTKTNRGVKEWEIKASLGQYFRNKNLATFEDVTVKIFLKEGQTLILVGDKARVATDNKKVEVWSNVVVSSDNQYEFYTESLMYASKGRRIFTRDKVLFTGYGMEVSGVGITIDIDKEKFFVLNSVSTVLRNTEEIKLN